MSKEGQSARKEKNKKNENENVGGCCFHFNIIEF